MLGLRTTENGTRADESQSKWAQTSMSTCSNEFRFLKMAGSLPRRQGIGRLKGKKKDCKGRIQQVVERFRNGRIHGTKKGLWNVAREKMLQDRCTLPKEGGDHCKILQNHA